MITDNKKVEAEQLSLIKMEVTVGFIYWLKETHNLRGLRGVGIKELPTKIKELKSKYDIKYPNGLTGWNS